MSGRCTAEAERDFDAHREVLPLLPEARSSNVDFVNDCDSGGGGFTTASTESGITDATPLQLQRAGWVPLDGDELLQYGDVGAVVSRCTGDTRVVVIADKRPDDNPITEITIQTEH